MFGVCGVLEWIFEIRAVKKEKMSFTVEMDLMGACSPSSYFNDFRSCHSSFSLLTKNSSRNHY